MSLHSAKDRLGWPPLWDMDSSVTESNFLKLSVCRWLYAPWGQWMSTVSHGFVFCAQQPEGCQGLRSGILQQLFVHLGRQWICTGIFFFFHRDHFIILWAQTLPAKRPWFSARKNNIPIPPCCRNELCWHLGYWELHWGSSKWQRRGTGARKAGPWHWMLQGEKIPAFGVCEIAAQNNKSAAVTGTV